MWNEHFFPQNLDLIEHKLYERRGERQRLVWVSSFIWWSYVEYIVGII
jgi:hypothetical protein